MPRCSTGPVSAPGSVILIAVDPASVRAGSAARTVEHRA